MNNEILKYVSFLSSDYLWLYYILVIIFFYIIIGLLKGNYKKPLLFIGIPSLIVGFMLLVSYFMAGIIPLGTISDFIPHFIKPLLTISIICMLMGLLMIIIYKILKKQELKNTD